MIPSCNSPVIVLLPIMASFIVPWGTDAAAFAPNIARRAAKGRHPVTKPLQSSTWGRSANNNGRAKQKPFHRQFSMHLSNSSSDQDSKDTSEKNALEEELERLQNQLALIEALEERNKAQLDSFVDEQDQWDSMEEEDRQLLRQKDEITQRMETLAEEMVQIWMGAKSMDG